MSAQDREALLQARAKAAETDTDGSMMNGRSIAETAVPLPNHQMEVDDLERELSGAI